MLDTETSAMVTTFVGGLVRHGLTVAAGWLAAHGVIDGSATEGFVAAGVTIATVGWSLYQKFGHAKVAAELDRVRGVTRLVP